MVEQFDPHFKELNQLIVNPLSYCRAVKVIIDKSEDMKSRLSEIGLKNTEVMSVTVAYSIAEKKDVDRNLIE